MLNISNKTWNKWIFISLLLVLLLAVGTGTVLSYIMDEATPVENILKAGEVKCEVQETFDGNVKTDVSVKNIGNTEAYIRAAIILNWVSETDTTEILARQPKVGVDCEIIYGEESWFQGDDGYWYHSLPVLPEESTAVLIEKATLTSEAPEGYTLSLEIVASAIQSTPANVVKTEWQVALDGVAISQ